MSENALVCAMSGFPPALIASCNIDEIINNMGVKLMPCSADALMQREIVCHILAVYLTDEICDRAISDLRAFLETTDTSRVDVLLVCPLEFKRDLAEGWALGIHSVIPVSDTLDNLYWVLSRIANARRERDMLSRQLHEASEIALLSMSASSQLGEIVRFMEKSYQCETCKDLAVLLEKTLENMGLSTCGLLTVGEEVVYFGDADKRPYLERLLRQQQDRGRYVDIENRTTLNFDSVTIMARNLPEPGSEPYGRMKDVLFSLVEGVDVRVKAIAATRSAAMLEKTKLDFLAVMSHELRTPMNSILGFAVRLKSKKAGDTLSARDVSGLEYIAGSAERLMGILDKMQELTRMEANAERDFQRVLVADLLAGPLKKYEALAREKALSFHVHWSDPGLTAELDPRRLSYVITELLDNALKFTSAGGIDIRVETDCPSDGQERLVLQINDSGAGIEPARLAHLFAPLGRVDDFIARGNGGSQLGLALTNKLVADLKGELVPVSEPGKGTSMTVRVPRFVSQDVAVAQDVELF